MPVSYIPSGSLSKQNMRSKAKEGDRNPTTDNLLPTLPQSLAAVLEAPHPTVLSSCYLHSLCSVFRQSSRACWEKSGDAPSHFQKLFPMSFLLLASFFHPTLLLSSEIRRLNADKEELSWSGFKGGWWIQGYRDWCLHLSASQGSLP